MVSRDTYQLASLLQQSRTGNTQAFNTLLGRLRPYLLALVRSWLGPDLARPPHPQRDGGDDGDQKHRAVAADGQPDVIDELGDDENDAQADDG